MSLFLEHDVKTRLKVREIEVRLKPERQSIGFEIPLPHRELGHALVAVFTSGDGRDVSETAEYFNIADNFYRVAIHGGIGSRGARKSSDRISKQVGGARSSYINCSEFFAWAEEDMVEMSSEGEYWFSGQTNYHLSRTGLQNLIEAAHGQGISVVTYGKFVMSGYLGWKTAYDYPNDHKNQYFYPVGMWEGVNVPLLDRFRSKEFVPYGYRPHVKGERVFDVWWQNFMPINPDHTPRMVRVAAEEVIRSIEMFGWDGLRWDGHPRGGGQCGGAGRYNFHSARKTQSLVRYFKDIVNEEYPKFRHGYNYYFVQKEPDYNWSYEDFELDELCRGGGLVMNESIRNSAGKPFEWIARNVQVEGDLSRERGGYLLGISCDGASDRDVLVESIIYFAGGCRPMGAVSSNRQINRYGTRYSKYSFDETLSRLGKPERILKPSAPTKLWWQPFVYETRIEEGRKQLVVNLLNIPRQGTPKGEKASRVVWDLNPGTDPFAFELMLPADHRPLGAHVIDPFSLEVSPATMEGNRVQIPAVAIWKVLVVDLDVDEGAESLSEKCGSIRTLNAKRKNLKVDRIDALALDISKSVVEVNKDMSALSPNKKRNRSVDDLSLEKMSWDERNRHLLEEGAKRSPERLIKGWWKGGSLPADLKLKDKVWSFGDLTPKRNGVVDIFYGRGAIDYRLRFIDIFSGLERFRLRDGPLAGSFRHHPGLRLRNGISWQEFPNYDLLLYTSIPHCAIGVENSYALVEYVKAGGAVLMTGGEYAFGKGGYDFTILERELLPVKFTTTVDVKYSETPLAIEPGKDLRELKASLDFSQKPSFWAYNQVALKESEGVKVFLKSGNRPVLIGWQLGKGRLACLLVAHRGTSEEGTTAYFDWEDWPRLMRALITWLSPDALKDVPITPREPEKKWLTMIRSKLESAMFEDGIDLEDEGGVEGGDDEALAGLSVLGQGTDGAGNDLKPDDLKERLVSIRDALKGRGPVISALLGEQVSSVGNLPFKVRNSIIDFIRRYPPEQLLEIAKVCVADKNAVVRGSGYQLLAISGSPQFVKEMNAKPGAFETDPLARERLLALSLVYYPRPDLQKMGEKKLETWNRTVADMKARWTGGEEFSLKSPALPLLDAESLFQRVAWLAYLSRLKPDLYCEQFAKEWLMTSQYQDYCGRSINNLWGMNMTAKERKRAAIVTKVWQELSSFYARLRFLARKDIDRLFRSHSSLVASGFARAHYTLEARQCISFLGAYTRDETKGLLDILLKAKHPMLSNFAKVRKAETK